MSRPVGVALLVGGLLVACRGDATPTPAPTEPAASGEAELRVIKPVVEYRAQESDPLLEVEPGETEAINAAANIVVGDEGHGIVSWPDFLLHDLLSGTDTLVSLAEPGERRAILDQAAGTARYRLQGPGQAAELAVVAGWTEISVDEGIADFIVSFLPGDPATVWLVVVAGEATVSRGVGDDEDAEPSESVVVGEGEGIALPEEGDFPAPQPVDVPAVEQWFVEVAAGSAEVSIASVAFRCEVTAAVTLLVAPEDEAEETAVELEEGDAVAVIQRGPEATWLRVYPVDADIEDNGWALARRFRCMAPLSSASPFGPEDDVEATATVPRPTRGPTVVFMTATPGATATPTMTPTPGGDAVVEFWADDDEIERGECTDLNWRTENISQVFYQGEGKVGTGSEEECPDSTTTYELRVVYRDGSEETFHVEVEVEDPEPDATDTPSAPEATDTPVSIPTNTMAPVPTNTMAPMPTNTMPMPTDPPQPTATDPPQPTDTPEPTPGRARR